MFGPQFTFSVASSRGVSRNPLAYDPGWYGLGPVVKLVCCVLVSVYTCLLETCMIPYVSAIILECSIIIYVHAFFNFGVLKPIPLIPHG